MELKRIQKREEIKARMNRAKEVRKVKSKISPVVQKFLGKIWLLIFSFRKTLYSWKTGKEVWRRIFVAEVSREGETFNWDQGLSPTID